MARTPKITTLFMYAGPAKWRGLQKSQNAYVDWSGNTARTPIITNPLIGPEPGVDSTVLQTNVEPFTINGGAHKNVASWC